eukprot:683121_1
MVTLHWMLYTLALITLGALSKSQQSFDSMEDSVSDDDEYNCNIFEKKIELCMVWRRVYCEYNPKFNIEKCLKARHCCLFELPTSDDDSDDSTDSDESTDAKCSNGQCDARYCVCDETINGKDFCRIKVRDDRCYFKPCYSDTNCKHGFGCVVACRSFPVCIPQCTIFNDESSSASRSRSISFDSISFSSSSSAHPKPTRKPTPKPTNKPTPKPTPKPTLKPTDNPTASPTIEPTFHPILPTFEPTQNPTKPPSIEPTPNPTVTPSLQPTNAPTDTRAPTTDPTIEPTPEPTPRPTDFPTSNPTFPTAKPSFEPTPQPTPKPTDFPTLMPSIPTDNPTYSPSPEPTPRPTRSPVSLPATLRVYRYKPYDANNPVPERWNHWLQREWLWINETSLIYQTLPAMNMIPVFSSRGFRFLVLCAADAVLLVVCCILLTIYCHRKQRRRKRMNEEEDDEGLPERRPSWDVYYG